jgi:chromosome segregation ATPase
MCGPNKRFFIYLLLALLFVFSAGALRSQELSQPGKTQPLLPASERQSNSSGEHLETWNRLSEKFDKTLETHEATLSEALRNLQTSELNGSRLSDLLNQSLRQNEDLRNYNDQIGERMQERDTDLADAYDDINRMEKTNLKLIIALIIMGSVITGYCAIRAVIFFVTKRI